MRSRTCCWRPLSARPSSARFGPSMLLADHSASERLFRPRYPRGLSRQTPVRFDSGLDTEHVFGHSGPMHRTSVRSGEWVAAPSSGRRGSGIHSCRQTGAGGSDPEMRAEADQTRSRHQTLSRVLISVTAMMALVLVLASGVAARDSEAGSVTVTVVPGDTLWGLAVEATPAGTGCAGELFEIEQRNGLTDSGSVPGSPESSRRIPSRPITAGSVSLSPYRANHVPRARRRHPGRRLVHAPRCRPAPQGGPQSAAGRLPIQVDGMSQVEAVDGEFDHPGDQVLVERDQPIGRAPCAGNGASSEVEGAHRRLQCPIEGPDNRGGTAEPFQLVTGPLRDCGPIRLHQSTGTRRSSRRHPPASEDRPRHHDCQIDGG